MAKQLSLAEEPREMMGIRQVISCLGYIHVNTAEPKSPAYLIPSLKRLPVINTENDTFYPRSKKSITF